MLDNQNTHTFRGRRPATVIAALAAGAALAIAPLSAASAAPVTTASSASAAAAALTSGTDEFNRTVSAGWGTGALGAWVLKNAASNYSVSNGSGVLTAKPGQGTKAITGPVAWKYDVRHDQYTKTVGATFTLPKKSQGSGQVVTVIAHEVGSTALVVRVVVAADGSGVLETILGGKIVDRYALTDTVFTPGAEYTLSVEVSNQVTDDPSAMVLVHAGVTGAGTWEFQEVLLAADHAFMDADGSVGVRYAQASGASSAGTMKVNSVRVG
jgi:hypothetical protein